MPSIHRAAHLPYSCEKIYHLVNDVEHYSVFLPWCHAATILESKEHLMRASIEIKKLGLSKRFTTENHLTPYQSISMKLLDGPFRHLHGEWRFIDLANEESQVILDLDFEFLPGIFSLPFKKIFEPAADSMLQAFVSRAHVVYGNK